MAVRGAAIIPMPPPSHYRWYGYTSCLKQCNQQRFIRVPCDTSACTPQLYKTHAQVTAADVTNDIELGPTQIKLHIQDCVLIELSDGIRRVVMPVWPTTCLWWQVRLEVNFLIEETFLLSPVHGICSTRLDIRTNVLQRCGTVIQANYLLFVQSVLMTRNTAIADTNAQPWV